MGTLNTNDLIYIPSNPDNDFGFTPRGTTNSTIAYVEKDWIIDQHSIAILEKYQNNAPLLALPLSAKVTLSTIMTISLLIGSYFKSIMYMFVFKTNKYHRGWMHRPINVLTVTSAIIHHVTHVAAGIWYILVLLMDNPLVETFGVHSCQVMMGIAVYGLIYLSIGSLGIAIYRVFYIKHEHLVKYIIGEKNFLLIFLTLSTTFTLLLSGLYMAEDNGDKSGINMCTGMSISQNLALIKYKERNGEKTMVIKYGDRISIIICLAAQMIEFCIYIWFFRFRYKNDNENMSKYLKQENIRARNQKNVSTFLGQFYGFIAGYSFLLSALVIDYFTDENSQHLRAVGAMAKFIDFGLLSAVEFFSSPGLRSFMK